MCAKLVTEMQHISPTLAGTLVSNTVRASKKVADLLASHTAVGLHREHIVRAAKCVSTFLIEMKNVFEGGCSLGGGLGG